MFSLIQNAQRLYKQENYQECLHYIKKAESKFSQSQEFEPNINRLMTLRLKGQAYGKLNKLDVAFKALEIIDNTMNLEKLRLKAGDKHNLALFYAQIHKLHTSYGILLLDQSDTIDQEVDYKQKSEIIQKCLSKFILAHKITRTKFMTSQTRGEDIQVEWFQHYSSDLINLINVHIMQGQIFDDLSCFYKALKITQKIQNFYEIHQKRKLSKKNLYKCYYYKGAIYRKLWKYQEAKKYLLKDQKYCLDHNEKQLLEANWKELLSVYVLTGDYENAILRTRESTIKTRIRQIATQEKNLRKTITSFNTKPSFDMSLFQDIIIMIFDLEADRPLFNELANISSLALTKYKNLSKADQFEIKFTLAESYFKLNKYNESFDIVNKLLAIEKNQKEIIRCMMLKNQNYVNLHPKEIQIYQELHNKALNLARKLQDDKSIGEIRQLYKKTKQKYQRSKTYTDIELSDDQSYMIKPFIEIPMEVEGIKKVQLFDVNNNTNNHIATRHDDSYSKFCQEHNVQPNTLIKQKIKVQKSQVLKLFYSLEPDHILAILKTIQCPKSIDLGNHIVDINFWQKLVKEIDSKRVNLQKLQQLCIHPFLQNQSPLQKFITKCQNLSILKLSNILVRSTIQNANYNSIHTLVLDTVNLNDTIISNIPFHQMEYLNSLDLRNNILTGRCFTYLNKILQKLDKLNLSSNPLHQYTKQNLQVTTQKLVLKDITFTKQLSYVLIDSLYTCQSLSLSESLNIQNLMSLVNFKFDNEKVPINIKRLKLNQIQFVDSIFFEVCSFFIVCSKSLRMIEMKMIENKEEFMSRLLEFIDSRYTQETVLDYRGTKFRHLNEEGHKIQVWF